MRRNLALSFVSECTPVWISILCQIRTFCSKACLFNMVCLEGYCANMCFSGVVHILCRLLGDEFVEEIGLDWMLQDQFK